MMFYMSHISILFLHTETEQHKGAYSSKEEQLTWSRLPMCHHFSAIPQILLSQWNPSIYCIMHTPTFLFVNQALWPILLDGNVCDSVVKVLFVWFSFKRSLHLNGNYCNGRKFGFCFANVFSFWSSIIYNSLNWLEVQFGSFFFFFLLKLDLESSISAVREWRE